MMSGSMLRFICVAASCAALGGCLSFENNPTAAKAANLLMFQSTTVPKSTGLTASEPTNTALNIPAAETTCPQVTINDSGAAIRAYGGQAGDSQAVRNQIAITQVARECISSKGDGSFTLKVGVQGRAIIGPAGSPGSYQTNLRIVVKRSDKVIASRMARVGATIASGQAGADFVHVEDGIFVPAGATEPDIEVSLDGGGAPRAARRRR